MYFSRGLGPDKLYMRAGFLPEDPYDPTESDFIVTISNANGLIYQGTIFPGDLRVVGRTYRFVDRTTPNGPGIRDGIKRLQLSQRPDGLWRFELKAFADLSAADLAEMTVHMTTDGNEYEVTAVWDERGNGWSVELKRLP
jgi:hypothetical protein